MGKENHHDNSIRNARRFNPYATPINLRPLREFKYFPFSKNSSSVKSGNSNVDLEALTEYQKFLNCIQNPVNQSVNNFNNNIFSTPLRQFQSPGYPIKELKIHRSKDSILQKLSILQERIRSLPDTSSSKVREAVSRFVPAKSSYSNGILTGGDYRMSGSRRNSIIDLTRDDRQFTTQHHNGMRKSELISSMLNSYKNLNTFNAAPSPRELSPGSMSNYPSKSITPSTINLGSSASSIMGGNLLDKCKSTPDLSKMSSLYASNSRFRRSSVGLNEILDIASTEKTSEINGSVSSVIFKEDKSSVGRRTSMGSSQSEVLAELERRHKIERNERAYSQRKQEDEKEMRLKKIQELEREARLRSAARRNRQISTEELVRMRLRLEGLQLERKPAQEDFPELPEEANDLLKRAWDCRLSPLEVFSSAFSVDITRRDLLSLKGVDWLNDEIINFYLNLIVERSRQDPSLPKVYAFNTFFYQSLSLKGYDAVKRWTRKVDIFLYDLLLIPIHLSVHWCMATVDLKNRRITYYDSMLGDNDLCLQILRDYLPKEHENKKKEPLNMGTWKICARKDIPRQLNGSDCGMFACKFAEYESRQADINFTQAQMPYFRQRMVYEICTQKLL